MKGCILLSNQNANHSDIAGVKKIGIIMIIALIVFFTVVSILGKFKFEKDQPDISGKHHAEIVVRDYGTITVELDADAAPITVDNFLKLADQGFYDGLTFHRIYPYFMIQGGSPEGDGIGGNGDETIKGEFKSNGWDKNTLTHVRGCISMARTKMPDSASSQFFIVHEDSTYLDGDYASFGYVTEGMDVVDALCDWVASGAVVCDGNGVIQDINEMPIIETVRRID